MAFYFLFSSLEEYHPMHYFICNPINKQWVALPTPNTTSCYVAHGFIFHATQHNPRLDVVMPFYKVVRAIGERGIYSTNLTIEIFSSELPNPEWKLFNLRAPFDFSLDFIMRSTVISQKGVIYFRARVKENRGGLVFFDQNEENDCCLQQIDFPAKPETNGDCFDLSDGLIVYACHKFLLRQINIWVLNEDNKTATEWSLQHTVSFGFPLEKISRFDIEAFHPLNPQVIFIHCSGKRFSYNVENSRLRLLSKGAEDHYNLFPYTYGLIGSHLFLDS